MILLISLKTDFDKKISSKGLSDESIKPPTANNSILQR